MNQEPLFLLQIPIEALNNQNSNFGPKKEKKKISVYILHLSIMNSVLQELTHNINQGCMELIKKMQESGHKLQVDLYSSIISKLQCIKKLKCLRR